MEKQQCGQITSKMNEIPQPPASSIAVTDCWTKEETLLAVEGLKFIAKRMSFKEKNCIYAVNFPQIIQSALLIEFVALVCRSFLF